MRTGWIGLSVLLATAGCNSGPVLHVKNAPPAQVEEGWKVLETKDGAASFGIPSYWRSATERSGVNQAVSDMFEQTEGFTPTDEQADQAVGNLDADMQAMAKESESNEEKDRIKTWAEKGILLMAFDRSRPIPGEPRTSITLTRKEGEGRGTVEDALKKMSTGMPGTVESAVVELPIGPAGEMRATYTTISGDEISEVKYVILDGGDKYLLSFITANGVKNIGPIARPVADSLRIRPKASPAS